MSPSISPYHLVLRKDSGWGDVKAVKPIRQILQKLRQDTEVTPVRTAAVEAVVRDIQTLDVF